MPRKPYVQEMVERLELKCDVVEAQCGPKKSPRKDDTLALISLARFIVGNYWEKNAKVVSETDEISRPQMEAGS